MKKGLLVSVALIVLQALLVAVYLLVERGRDEGVSVRAERLDRPSPELTYRTFDAGDHRLSDHRGSPVLVHFWATWCPPCRYELPALLKFAGSGDIRVLAASVDPDWSKVREFLGQEPPPAVVLAASPAAAEEFGVATLPESYLVDETGQLRLRIHGAGDWGSVAWRRATLGMGEGRESE